MNAEPSTPENDAQLSGLGRALLETVGSKPSSGPWVPPTAEELGKLLLDYEIVKMLGRGGMGAVYMGRQKSLDRPVAIKILSTVLEDADSSFAERFKNEARAMGKLNHPGIVGVYDFGETADGLLYIVMEFVEGTDVARMIAKKGRLHTDHAMAITAHVCDALGYAHERGIIHRDIKPANIMVGYDGVVKVADFGLAKMTHSNASGLTQSGMAMGTLHYMAPEALMLGSSVDHRADIYAVGVMLYQMLTGKIPQGMFKLPSLQIPGLDPRYDGIITKAIMEDREARYQKVGEMRHDLDGILTQPVVRVEPEVSQAPAALPTQARPQRPGGQPYRPQQPVMQPVAKKSGGWLIWAVLGVIALGGGYVWMNLNSPAQQTSASEPPAPAPTEAPTSAPVVSTVTIPSTPASTPPATPTVIPTSPKAAVVRKPWPAGPNFRSEGRFRAWSSVTNDSKLDLTKLQGVDDAVQVYVNSNGWLVLRRTGDVISNLNGADGLKDIKRVCRGNADDFALINRAGGVIPFPQRTDPANRIPDGLGPVKDVYISSFRQVAILEDGSLVAWGTAHDGIDTPGNGEWKDKPVLPPGRKAVAMSNTTAAMGLRTDDGKILRWGDNGGFGRSQGKFDADPGTPFLMNGMALYAVPKTDGPILVANWRGNDPATPFADDIRGRDFIPANNGGKHIVLLDLDGRLVLDPMCPDRSITAALDFVTLAERDLVSVHFSDKSQPATRFLWFDKASSSSPTPSVGAISPTSGSLLAIPDFRTRVANYQKARHSQLAELTTKYRSALTAEKDAATKTGVLAAVTAADAAIANAASFVQVIEQNLTATDVKPLPALATVADPAPPRLIELRDIFVREVEKIETTLVASLDQSLATVQTSLTTAMSLDAAKGVESHRQQIKAAFSTANTRQASTVEVAAPRPAAAGDWPQWRGPNRDDVSTETGLLKQWPAAGPKRLWVNSGAGLGYSGFAIVGNKLYTMGLYDAEERLICLDASTGTKTWETTVGAIYKNGWGDGPRCTPTVADGMVYALGGNGDLVCADATTGTKIWNTSLTKDLGGKLQSWGYTESPLVDAGLVLITPGGGSGAIASLDARTGKVTWQTSGVKEAAQYSSIIPLDLNGQRQYAQLLMTTLVGFSGDGQVLWQTPFPGRTAVIPTPIFKDDIVYVAAGYNAGCKAIKLGGTAPVEVYANTNMVNHHGGVILLDDCLYGHSDKGGWTCQDFKTGAIVWQDRGIGKGAVACADGMLYCLGENDGTIALVPASKNGWNMVSSFKLAATSSQRNPKGKIWTHPVISNGKLYLRDQEFISCYDVKN